MDQSSFVSSFVEFRRRLLEVFQEQVAYFQSPTRRSNYTSSISRDEKFAKFLVVPFENKMFLETGRPSEIDIDPDQLEDMLDRLIHSKQFVRKRVLKSLLVYLVRNAVERPVAKRKILAAVYSHRDDPGDAPRPDISKLRDILDSYYLENDEPIRIEISKSPYRVILTKTPLRADTPALDSFWLPFTAREKAVKLFISPKSEFWDTDPRRHVGRMPGRPEGVLDEMYLPLGLIDAVLTLSTFLRSKNRKCILDTSFDPPRPSYSVILIGDAPFEQTQPREIALSNYAHENEEALEVGVHADHYREEKGVQLFCCYARILRIPLSFENGAVALRISAFHSIAVEAAARFLVSSKGARQIAAHMTPRRDRTPQDRIFGNSVSRQLAETVEDLGIVLRVTCSILKPEALSLKPAIPRGLLKIEEVEIFEFKQPEEKILKIWSPRTGPEPR